MIDKQKINHSHKQYWNTCLLSSYSICCNYFTQDSVEDYFDDYFREFKIDFSDPMTFFSGPFLQAIINEPLFAIHYHTNFNRYLIDYQRYINGQINVDYLMTRYAVIFVYQFHIRTNPNFIPFCASQNRLSGYAYLKLLHENVSEKRFGRSRDIISVECFGKDAQNNLTGNCLNIITAEQLIDLMKKDEVLINAMYEQPNAVHSCTIYFDSNTNVFYKHDTDNPENDDILPNNWIEYTRELLLFQKKTRTV